MNVSLSLTPQLAAPAPAYAYPAEAQPVPMATASCPPKDAGMVAPAPAKAAY